MVSLRCKMLVKEELKNLGLKYVIVNLGMVEMLEKANQEQRDQLKINLQKWGLELLDDKKSILIEKIKNVIVEMIHYSDDLPSKNYSAYISEKLNYDYTYLSNIFSEVKGTTIQQFIITHKIERVKELFMTNLILLRFPISCITVA
jgi:AraC-like DNA-binding protein